jgi:hypothetical protein
VVAQEIGLTAEEVLSASMRALGLDPLMAVNMKQAIFDKYAQLIRETKRIPTQLEVARQLGIQQSVVSRTCADLVAEGRMHKLEIVGRKPGYIPLIAAESKAA